jgi:hypothetical protein
LGESSPIQSASVAKYARIQFKKGNFKYGSGETRKTSKAVILIDAFVAVHESVWPLTTGRILAADCRFRGATDMRR